MDNNRDERPFDMELRIGDDGVKRLEGYAVVFGAISEDPGGFRETFEPGAFTDALAAQPDVLALVNHDPNRVIGRTTNGTPELQQDGRRAAHFRRAAAYELCRGNLRTGARAVHHADEFCVQAAQGRFETFVTVDGQRLRKVQRRSGTT